ncbi:MAG TPA: 5'-nucleotidase C-terminal domain-containing protein [Anaerolineales bacterium]
MKPDSGPRLLSVALILAFLLAPLTAASAGAGASVPGETVDLQILDVSDWHAQLDPLSVSGVGLVGGAAVLSAYFQADRAANPNTLTLTAGDAYGASPPLSSFFEEVPAVEAMNLMGFDADTFGNHNFDRGIAHLQSMIDLADFPYVSANLKNVEDNLADVQPFEIFEVGGVKVAVIGITNPEAPTLVFPGSFGTIEVTDPVPAANRARADARRAGAKVFVAITHLGVAGFDPATGAPFGPLIDFASNVGGFDVIIGDHTDVEFQGIINHALVVENRSKGRTYARMHLTVDPQNGRVLDRSAEFVTPLASAVTPDPAIEALLENYRSQLAPIFNSVVGESTVFIPRADACGNGAGRTCESLVGNVVADALRHTYGADFAITNSGGLRADLTCPTADNPSDFCPAYTPPPFPITRGQVLTVLPFGNVVVTLEVNGAELKTMLENGVSAMPGANGRFPEVSGLCFTYDISAPAGNRVTGAVFQAADGTCTGPAVDLTAATTYTLAENDFMASGGDGYPNFASRMTTREIMDQVLADYIAAQTPISPAIEGRIVCTTSGATLCPVVTP